MQLLQKLMQRSLSLWKPPEKEMNKLVKRLEITPKMLCRELEKELSKGKLYIDSTIIKTEVGTLLWDRMIVNLKNRNIEYFTFLSDVNAQELYEKKGAIRINEQLAVVFKRCK